MLLLVYYYCKMHYWTFTNASWNKMPWNYKWILLVRWMSLWFRIIDINIIDAFMVKMKAVSRLGFFLIWKFGHNFEKVNLVRFFVVFFPKSSASYEIWMGLFRFFFSPGLLLFLLLDQKFFMKLTFFYLFSYLHTPTLMHKIPQSPGALLPIDAVGKRSSSVHRSSVLLPCSLCLCFCVCHVINLCKTITAEEQSQHFQIYSAKQ